MSQFEEELLDKLQHMNLPGIRINSLRDIEDQTLNKLFQSLFMVYDSTWAPSENEENTGIPKQIKKEILRYLRLMDIGHLAPNVNVLRPGNSAVIRSLQAIVGKLEDKYGGRLKYHVSQVFKTSNKRKMLARNTKEMNPKPTEQNKEILSVPTNVHLAPTTPSNKASLQPKTPLTARTKLLNGLPLTPGSELRGREIQRSPPTNVFTHDLSPIKPRHPVVDQLASPALKKTKYPVNDPIDAPRQTKTPKINSQISDQIGTGTTIPTGRQLPRTPTEGQMATTNTTENQPAGPINIVVTTEATPSQEDLKTMEPETSINKNSDGSNTPEQGSAIANLLHALSFMEDEEESEGKAEKEETEVERDEPRGSPGMDSKDSSKDGQKCLHPNIGQTDVPVSSRNGIDDRIIVRKSLEEVPRLALNCPQDLQCTETDLEFLQHQQGISEVQALQKKADALKKQLEQFEFQKGLLQEEKRNVVSEIKDLESEMKEMGKSVRRILTDVTNQSPSVLTHSQKQQLLSQNSHQMAARIARCEKLVHREMAAQSQADQTLNTTAFLQERKTELEISAQEKKRQMSELKDQLTQQRLVLEKEEKRRAVMEKVRTGGRGEETGGQEYMKRRLQALNERVRMLRERRRKFNEWFS